MLFILSIITALLLIWILYVLLNYLILYRIYLNIYIRLRTLSTFHIYKIKANKVNIDNFCVSLIDPCKDGYYIGKLILLNNLPHISLNDTTYQLNLFNAKAGKGISIHTKYFTDNDNDKLIHVQIPDDF